MAGHGGGAWKVAYADFVTAMMAFFLVMWITSQNSEVREAIAEHFQDPMQSLSGWDENSRENSSPYEPAKRSKGADGREPPQDKKPGRRSRRPTLLMVGDGKRAAIGAALFFNGSSVELDQQAKDELTRLLPSILGKPQKIEIRGHASRRPPPADSPFRDAWQLSFARCKTTQDFLESHGIGPERIRLSQAGAYEPYTAAGENDDPLAHLERVEVHLLNEVARTAAVRAPVESAPARKLVDHAHDHASAEHSADPHALGDSDHSASTHAAH